MTISVTFLCPHGAAKSVAAAGYFDRAALAHGLEATVDTAGTDPDEAVMATVRSHLEAREMKVASPPRLVTDVDLAADVIVNLGCDLTGFDVVGQLHEWDDVPMPSESLAEAMATIERHASALAAELSRA